MNVYTVLLLNKSNTFFKNIFFNSMSILTGVLEVHIISIDGVLQSVDHYLELHDLFAYSHVWFGNVNLHLRIIDLTGQPVSHQSWQIPDRTQHNKNDACNIIDRPK